jgi:hypothetical protein
MLLVNGRTAKQLVEKTGALLDRVQRLEREHAELRAALEGERELRVQAANIAAAAQAAPAIGAAIEGFAESMRAMLHETASRALLAVGEKDVNMSDHGKEPDVQEFKAKHPKLYEAILGDGRTLTDQLLIASLYVMGFECLKDFIEDSFDTFFSDGFSIENGTIVSSKSESYGPTLKKYRKRYRELSKSLMGDESNRIGSFHAACAWFHDMEAFDDNDLTLIIAGIHYRNNFSHELYRWIVDDKLSSLHRNFVNIPLNLFFKISNWWIRNFEATIAPEDYERFIDDDMRRAASANVYLLQLIVDKVLPPAAN